MKRIIFLLIAIAVFSQFIFAQSLKIVPKKIVYKRPKVAIDNAFGMRYFTITYPKILSKTGRKIEDILSYEKWFEFKLKDEFNVERGIRNLKYRILFNSKNILSVKLMLDAYTFSDLNYEKFVTLNTKTAKTIKPIEVFTNLHKLAKLCRKYQIKSIDEAKKRFTNEEYGTIYDTMDFTVEELNVFTIGSKGVTFHYPYRFGRTAIIFEPDFDYFLTWKELKPFIKKDSLFAQFVK